VNGCNEQAATARAHGRFIQEGPERESERQEARHSVQSSLDQKQRLQSLFFPEGIAFDGARFNRTAVTAPLFSYLAEKNVASEDLVSPVGIEP
jgi:hypothetical protein